MSVKTRVKETPDQKKERLSPKNPIVRVLKTPEQARREAKARRVGR